MHIVFMVPWHAVPALHGVTPQHDATGGTNRVPTLLLEPYPKGMYVTYPYLGSHGSRVLVIIR